MLKFKINDILYIIYYAYSANGNICRPLFLKKRIENEEQEKEWLEKIKNLDTPAVFHSTNFFQRSRFFSCFDNFSLVSILKDAVYDYQDIYIFRKDDWHLVYSFSFQDIVLYPDLDRLSIHTEPGRYDEWYYLVSPDIDYVIVNIGYWDYKKSKPKILVLKFNPFRIYAGYKIDEIETINSYVLALDEYVGRFSSTLYYRGEYSVPSLYDKYECLSKIQYLFSCISKYEVDGDVGLFLRRIKNFGRSRFIARNLIHSYKLEKLEQALRL